MKTIKTKRLISALLALTLLCAAMLSGCTARSDAPAAANPAAQNTAPEQTNGSAPVETGSAPVAEVLRYTINGRQLQDFDLGFLQIEDKQENVVYSPLSVKYALGMLNEGTGGESHRQIANLIGEYAPKIYPNSANLSLANAMFIRDSYEAKVKQTYLQTLTQKYGADVFYDSFAGADKINSWVEEKTLGLIKNLAQDSDVTPLDFALVNALAIDMEWEQKFLGRIEGFEYPHEKFWLSVASNVMSARFAGMDEEISGMEIVASVNNYDVVNELGADAIRQTVGDAFDEYMKENPYSWYLEGEGTYEEKKEAYLDQYLKEIGTNYHRAEASTDFSLYVDDELKAFAKDLKEYDGVTLRYVAIMPQDGDLADWLKNANAAQINDTISKLKEIRSENFPEGVVTKIVGFIPKFRFDYSLDLMNDLAGMGVTDVFDSGKADLSGITEGPAYIGKALHKANIEFTQDGIKASAATMLGGAGAGSDFDYFYDVPVEEIDMTFDKPFVFFVQDKDTGEVWFAGTVYQPLLLSEEPEAQGENANWIQEYSYQDYPWSGNLD